MGIVRYKVLFVIIFAATIFLPIACKQENVNGGECIDCEKVKPEYKPLSIKVTLNNENKSVPIVIYTEKYTTDKVLVPAYTDTLTSEEDTITVKTDVFYSVRAEYKSGSKIIYAIDGGFFDAFQQEACDNKCFQVIGGKYDVRLRNY